MEIAALVISVVALVVAVPPAFQMFFGKPRLYVEFEAREKQGTKQYICEISNRPIKNKLLHFIGVRRDAVNVYADFRVKETGTERVIVDTTRALLDDVVGDGEPGTLRRNLGDHFPAGFVCVLHRQGEAAAIIDRRADVKTPLSPGRYRIEVEVIAGTRLYSADKELSVGADPSSTYWVP